MKKDCFCKEKQVDSELLECSHCPRSLYPSTYYIIYFNTLKFIERKSNLLKKIAGIFIGLSLILVILNLFAYTCLYIFQEGDRVELHRGIPYLTRIGLIYHTKVTDLTIPKEEFEEVHQEKLSQGIILSNFSTQNPTNSEVLILAKKFLKEKSFLVFSENFLSELINKYKYENEEDKKHSQKGIDSLSDLILSTNSISPVAYGAKIKVNLLDKNYSIAESKCKDALSKDNAEQTLLSGLIQLCSVVYYQQKKFKEFETEIESVYKPKELKAKWEFIKTADIALKYLKPFEVSSVEIFGKSKIYPVLKFSTKEDISILKIKFRIKDNITDFVREDKLKLCAHSKEDLKLLNEVNCKLIAFTTRGAINRGVIPIEETLDGINIDTNLKEIYFLVKDELGNVLSGTSLQFY